MDPIRIICPPDNSSSSGHFINHTLLLNTDAKRSIPPTNTPFESDGNVDAPGEALYIAGGIEPYIIEENLIAQ